MDINYIAAFLRSTGEAIKRTNPTKEEIDFGIEHFIIIQMSEGFIDAEEANKLARIKEAILEALE